MENCLIVSNFGNLEHLQAFRDGLFYVQDPASKLSVLCAQIPQGEALSILDCCAAPGGKSFAAAIAAGEKAKITSCDVHPHKIELLQKGADRLGLTNVHPQLQDATLDRPEWHDQMDVVLADVPCSGYGIIRKKPDIREKSPASMAELPKLQLQILTKQADYVKPGGLLMYSTCTLVRKENEGVVEEFLKLHPEFHREPLCLPKNFPENTSGMLTLVPGEYETDGFFICRLRRES
jgi:16S rRNA (cytosine967-C5)-methyltransferase